MQINPLGGLELSAPYAATKPANGGATNRQIASAVQTLNKSVSLGQDRKLVYRRDPKTGHRVVQIVNRGTGDVVDQIPTEALLQLQAEFEQAQKAKVPPSTDSRVG